MAAPRPTPWCSGPWPPRSTRHPVPPTPGLQGVPSEGTAAAPPAARIWTFGGGLPSPTLRPLHLRRAWAGQACPPNVAPLAPSCALSRAGPTFPSHPLLGALGLQSTRNTWKRLDLKRRLGDLCPQPRCSAGRPGPRRPPGCQGDQVNGTSVHGHAVPASGSPRPAWVQTGCRRSPERGRRQSAAAPLSEGRTTEAPGEQLTPLFPLTVGRAPRLADGAPPGWRLSPLAGCNANTKMTREAPGSAAPPPPAMPRPSTWQLQPLGHLAQIPPERLGRPGAGLRKLHGRCLSRRLHLKGSRVRGWRRGWGPSSPGHAPGGQEAEVQQS